MSIAQSLIANATRRLENMFPDTFRTPKHSHSADFGFPTHITDLDFFNAYDRNSVAEAAVNKTTAKTFETYPDLRGSEDFSSDMTDEEKELKKHLKRIRFWQAVSETDRRALVSGYAGLIMVYRDGLGFDDPVDSNNGGIEKLARVIPAWKKQLTVASWVEDEKSEDFGEPEMYQFQEEQLANSSTQGRSFKIHPSRVMIWSSDNTTHARSLLRSGYNDLITIEKVLGAGGEGFWKNAKGSPVIEVDKEANLSNMAKIMGTDEEGMLEAMNEQVEDYQRGFDKMLMLQGMKATHQSISLPSPEHFYMGPLQVFAASVMMPVKILVGNITGERASTEDSKEWAKTCMSRRENWSIPSITDICTMWEEAGVLSQQDWSAEWEDLTEADMDQKIDRAVKMSSVNAQSPEEPVFLTDEIRDTVGLEPAQDIGDQ